MSETTVNQDKFSYYIWVNNQIYRTIHTSDTFQLYGHVAPNVGNNTKFHSGEKVRVKVISDTSLIIVRSSDGLRKEKWFLHGIREGKKRSTNYWDPV